MFIHEEDERSEQRIPVRHRPNMKSKAPAPVLDEADEESETNEGSIERKLECVIRVNMNAFPEPVDIQVYEGDSAHNLCESFCREHNVTDR